MANELIFDSSAKKTAVFLATIRSFPFPSTKTGIFMDGSFIWRFQAIVKSKWNKGKGMTY